MPTLIPGFPLSSRMTPPELKSRLTTPAIQATLSYLLLLVKAFLSASATQWGEFGDWNKDLKEDLCVEASERLFVPSSNQMTGVLANTGCCQENTRIRSAFFSYQAVDFRA